MIDRPSFLEWSVPSVEPMTDNSDLGGSGRTGGTPVAPDMVFLQSHPSPGPSFYPLLQPLTYAAVEMRGDCFVMAADGDGG